MSAQGDTNTIPDTETTEEEGPALTEMYLRLDPFELREKAGQMMPGEDREVYIDKRYEYLARRVVAARFDELLDEYDLLRDLFRPPSPRAPYPTVATPATIEWHALAPRERLGPQQDAQPRHAVLDRARRVKQVSELGATVFALSLLFHAIVGVAVIHPFLAASGLVMCACYWLMAHVASRRYHRRKES